MMSRKWRRKNGQKPLEFKVSAEPTRIDIEQWEPSKPHHRHFFETINDERILIDGHVRGMHGWVSGFLFLITGAMSIIGIAVAIFLTYGVLVNTDDPFWFAGIGVALIIIGCILAWVGLYHGSGMLATAYRHVEKPIIFDRMNGTVTLPPASWGEPETVPFHEIYVTKGFTIIPGGAPSHELLAIRSDGWPVDISLTSGAFVPGGWGSDSIARDWSFWVWYMDRNRPLPHGSAFDPYREKDLARLRAESAGRVGDYDIPGSLSLSVPEPFDAGQLLPMLGNVLERHPEVDWAAYGGVVYHEAGQAPGLRIDVKTVGDETMEEDRVARLMEELLAMAKKRWVACAYLELIFSPRPRGRVIYSRNRSVARDGVVG